MGFGLLLIVLTAILAFLFRGSFGPDQALFANDGPLGVLMSDAMKVPSIFSGYWMDLYWLGMNGGSAPISFTYGFLWLLGPVGFAKFYGPLTLLFLGVCAWMFFRTLKLPQGLSIVAALAVALNMNFFSNTCWGLGTRSTALGAAFLALAALNTRRLGNRWLNAALAGLALGISVIEGADNGVIFSMFVGAFALFQAWVENDTARKRLAGLARCGVLVIFALFIAVQVLIPLVGIATKGSASIATPQRPEDPAAKWDFATQWSLAPVESLRVLVPGLYGYRVDSPEGAEYWGRVGQQPGWEQHHQGLPRHSGAGEYAGVLVVLVAIWALAQSLRRARSDAPYPVARESGGAGAILDDRERKYIRFWGVMGLIALVLAWGRFAPFYRLIYPLPFFSSIRNPMKFMHPCHMVIMILFGYGLLGLSRRYLEAATNAAKRTASLFEKRWAIGCLAAFGLSLVVLGIYASSRGTLVRHLMDVGFSDPSQAGAIASFSIGEVGKFVFALLVSVVLFLMIQFGVFTGGRAKWAAVLLGVVVTVDLARSDVPWIQHYDYRDQYVSNPILDVLKDKSWEHRTVVFPLQLAQAIAAKGALNSQQFQQLAILDNIYRVVWLQKHFQYYNIQSLDMAQDPRPPEDKKAYLAAVTGNLARYWELTNTRYILGLAGNFADLLNQVLDPVQKRFRQQTAFALTQTRGSSNIGAQPNDAGPWALIEFTGALPRAKLYTQWQVSPTNEVTLARLGEQAFDPAQTVLVSDPIEAASANTNAPAGSVEFASYSPKQIDLSVKAAAPSVLLLNDKYDPDWKVTVNGQPAKLLRCNYLMRGVQVPPGDAKVRFHFEPSLTGLKITLVAMTIGLVLCGLLFVVRPAEAEREEALSKPVAPSSTPPVTQKPAKVKSSKS